MPRVNVLQIRTWKPLLKIVVRDVSNPEALEKLEKLFASTPFHSVVLGEIYIARTSPQEYARVLVNQIDKDAETADVKHMDSAKSSTVALDQLRLLQDAPLRKMKPLCNEYVLAGLKMETERDTRKEEKAIHAILVGNTFDLTIIPEDSTGTLVDLKFGGMSLNAQILPCNEEIRHGFVPIDIKDQIEILAAKRKGRDQKKAATQEEPAVITAIAKGNEHLVRVTHYDPNTTSFYVELLEDDIRYQQFQIDLQKYKSQACLPKSARRADSLCLVRMSDKDLWRAKIVRKYKGKMELQLLDTGKLTQATNDQIFVMPSELLHRPPYARLFKFDGVGKNLVEYLAEDLDKFYFGYLAMGRILTLKVVSTDGAIPTCQLFHFNANILDELISWLPFELKYPPQKSPRGKDLEVSVSAIASPDQFYVRIQSDKMNRRYKEIEEQLQQIDPPKLTKLTVGNACIVKIEGQFMRGRIITAKTRNIYQIVAVDTGFTDDVSCDDIRVPTKKSVEHPPLAFRCHLDGYNVCEHERKIKKLFEELSRNRFKMNVMKHEGSMFNVELHDLKSGRSVIKILKEADDGNCDDVSLTVCASETEVEESTLKPAKNNVTFHDDDINNSVWWNNNKSNWTEVQPSISEHFLMHPPRDSMSSDSDGSEDYDNSSERVDSNEKSSDWDENEKLLYDNLHTKADCKKPTSISPPASISSGTSSGISVMEMNQIREPIRITAVTQPTCFTVQLMSKVEEYEKFKLALQEQAKVQVPMTTFNVGSFCLAYNEFAGGWCRSIIADVDTSEDFLVSVKCVDDGNTFSVDKQEFLRISSVSLVFTPYFGINCSLPIMFNENHEDELIRQLINIRDKPLTARLLTPRNSICYIDIYQEGKNVADQIITSGQARPVIVCPSGPAYIIDVTSVTNFVVQMAADKKLATQMFEYCHNYVAAKVKEPPKKGMLVMAVDPTSKAWHRARINSIDNKNQQMIVDYIDYGKSELVTGIGAFTDPFLAEVHPLAVKCSLQLPFDLTDIGDKAEQKFISLAAFGNRKVFVELVKPSETTAYVNISLNKDMKGSILDQLLDNYAAFNFKSVMGFASQLNRDTAEVSYKCDEVDY